VVAKRSTELMIGRDLPSRATLLITEIFDAHVVNEMFQPLGRQRAL